MHTLGKISLQLLAFVIISTCFMSHSDLNADTLIAAGNIDTYIYSDSATGVEISINEGTFEVVVTYDSSAVITEQKFSEDCYPDPNDGSDICYTFAQAIWKNSLNKMEYKIYDNLGNLIDSNELTVSSDPQDPEFVASIMANYEQLLEDPLFTDNYGTDWSVGKHTYDGNYYKLESIALQWFDTLPFMQDYTKILNVDELSYAISSNFLVTESVRDDSGTRDLRVIGSINGLIGSIRDTDADGYNDDEDACVNSDLSATVIFNGNDSGVNNALLIDGCTISDSINALFAQALNHGEFVSAVTKFLNKLEDEGIISNSDKGAIQSAVATSK